MRVVGSAEHPTAEQLPAPVADRHSRDSAVLAGETDETGVLRLT
jgi:hypothetical protein